MKWNEAQERHVLIDLEIITDRLKLSPLIEADARALFEYRSDPEVCRYQSFEPGDPEDAVKFISGLEHDHFGVPDTWVQFGIRLRDSGRLIGDLGVHFIAGKPGQVEIGITLDSKRQGRGYATEALEATLGYLFVAHETRRMFASVDPRNEKCIRLLERVGMVKEAHFRKSVFFKGDWADDLVYAVLKSDWENH